VSESGSSRKKAIATSNTTTTAASRATTVNAVLRTDGTLDADLDDAGVAAVEVEVGDADASSGVEVIAS